MSLDQNGPRTQPQSLNGRIEVWHTKVKTETLTLKLHGQTLAEALGGGGLFTSLGVCSLPLKTNTLAPSAVTPQVSKHDVRWRDPHSGPP